MSGTPSSTVPPDSPSNTDEEPRVNARPAQPRPGQSAHAPSQPSSGLGALVKTITTALWGTVDIAVWTLDQSRPATRDFAQQVITSPVTTEPPASAEPPQSALAKPRFSLRAWLANSWVMRVARRLQHDLFISVIPSLDLLEGETIKLDIHQAFYRDIVPRRVLHLWWVVLIGLSAAGVGLGYLAMELTGAVALGLLGFAVAVLLLAWATEETLRYKQWRLVFTNWRTIVFIPTPRSRWLVDDVRMGAGKIQVVDVNYSHEWWWRMFQIATGARDLTISMSGYAFKSNAAEVQSGLVIPDVMPEDIKKLEEFIFKK